MSASKAELAALRADVRVLREVVGELIARVARGPLNRTPAELQDLVEKLQQVQG